MAKGKSSLLERIKSAKGRQVPNFFSKLPKDDQAELAEIKRAWNAGEIPAHVTVRDIHAEVSQEITLGVSDQALRTWLGTRG